MSIARSESAQAVPSSRLLQGAATDLLQITKALLTQPTWPILTSLTGLAATAGPTLPFGMPLKERLIIGLVFELLR